MRAKQYAVKLGLAKAGKGRMSREAHAAIQKAISEGMTFEDYGTPAKSQKTVKVDKSAKDGPQDVVQNPYAEPAYRYPRDQKFVYVDDNGKSHEIDARQACMNCRYSLVAHQCHNPVVLTKHGRRAVRPKGE